MKRVMKFRVWDKDCKKMHVCGENIHDSITFLEDGTAFYYNLQNGCGSGGEDATYELMQYTGDKNRGYEGDILEWVEPIRSEHGDIEDYEHCRGVVEWDNERSGFIVRCANGNEWLDALMNITAIGNVWENPELLQKGDV